MHTVRVCSEIIARLTMVEDITVGGGKHFHLFWFKVIMLIIMDGPYVDIVSLYRHMKYGDSIVALSHYF